MQDDVFRKLLIHFDRSWSGYRKVRKGVKKRIGRHMCHLGCPDMDAYLACLDRYERERKACDGYLAVSISRFFRDRQLWWALQSSILPSLVQRTGRPLTIWSAGCACGEEVYSFAILWDRMRRNAADLPPYALIATDIHLSRLLHARSGIYPESSLREVPDDLRGTYFERLPGRRWRVDAALQKGIVWMAHDFFSQAPGNTFDLIFLRNNLLTYFKDAVKGRVAQKIADALSPGGLLVIGAHERLPESVSGILSVSAHPLVFRKSG